MTLTDFFIIYLACGAPFGVYYFSSHRRRKFILLKSLVVALCWVFFAFRLLPKNIPAKALDSEKEVGLEHIKRAMEQMFQNKSGNISLFEFRETLDRYAGLTLANQNKNETPTEKDHEFSSLANRKNDFLTAQCLNRRNRKLLSFHQTLARRDFLQMANVFFESVADKKKLGDLLYEFVKLLDDAETLHEIGKIITQPAQSRKTFAVKPTENDLWKPERPRPMPANPTPIQLQVIPAVNSTVKD